MATQALALLPPHYHDSDGALLEGGKVYFYESGSQTIAPVYTDHTGLVEYTQPVVLDLRGEPPTEGIYLDTTRTYKIVIKRPDDTTLKTVDGYNIGGSVGPTGPAGPTGPQGPEGPEGPEGPVVYAEAQQPSFMAQISDVVTYTRSTLILQNETNSFKNWYGPSSIYSTSAHAAILDSQFDRTTLIFTATAAKRWFFTGTASFYNVGTTFPATTCFAIVVKRGSLSEKFIANQGQTSGDAGASSVSVVIDLQVGDQVSFGSNSISARGSYVFSGTQLSIPISQGGGGGDGKVYTSINDTISGFLDSKIVAGGGIALTEVAGTEDKAVSISLNPVITVPVTIQPPTTTSATPVLRLTTDGVGTDVAFHVSSDNLPSKKNFQLSIATDTVEGIYYSFGQGANKSAYNYNQIIGPIGQYSRINADSVLLINNLGTHTMELTLDDLKKDGVSVLGGGIYVPLDGSLPMTNSLTSQTAYRLYNNTADQFEDSATFEAYVTTDYSSLNMRQKYITGSSNKVDIFTGPSYTSATFQHGSSNQIYLTAQPNLSDLQVVWNSSVLGEIICQELGGLDTSYLSLIAGASSIYLWADESGIKMKTNSVGGTGTDTLLFPTPTGVTRTFAMLDQVVTAYDHSQGVAATVWTINHNLSHKPVIQTWDSSGAQIIGTIQHVSNNQATVTFATSQSGAGRCV